MWALPVLKAITQHSGDGPEDAVRLSVTTVADTHAITRHLQSKAPRTVWGHVAITLGRQDAPRSSLAHDVCVVITPSIMYWRLTESFGGWMLDNAAEQEWSGVSQGPSHRQIRPSYG